MPKKVSGLTLEDRANLTNAFQVVVTNPVDYELFRVPVTQFRGASAFVGDEAPTLNPADPLIPSYIDGDFFIEESEAGHILHIWDNTNTAWTSRTKLNGTRVLTATDYPDEINLDLREAAFIAPEGTTYENDYYLNKTLDLLYGGYSGINGFTFGSVTFQGYTAFRKPVVFDVEIDDVAKYDEPGAAIQDYIDNRLVDLADKLKYRQPIHGDVYHLKMNTNDGHEGYIYIFDGSIVPTGATFAENIEACFGLDAVGGDKTLLKAHARAEQNWNIEGAPVQNDLKYLQGDNVLDVTKGVLYYGYNEGLPDNTTNLGDLFTGQTVLSGSSLKTSQDDDGNWVTPTANTSKYQSGDYILAKDNETARIHGPYNFDATTDKEAWPLYTVLRPAIFHDIASTDTVPSGYSTDYPIFGGKMVVAGDYLRIIYTADVKEYLHTRGVVITEPTDTDDGTLEWDLDYRENGHQFRLTNVTDTGIPTVDNAKFYDGELVLNAKGNLYKYVEDFVNDPAVHSFELLNGLRPSVLHVVDTTTKADLAWEYTPDTDNESADWGTAVVQRGDDLEVRYSDDKVVIYSATEVAGDGTITWGNERHKMPLKREVLSNTTLPTADNMKYRKGDLVVLSDLAVYEYDEDENTGSGGWVFARVDREETVYYIEISTNSYDPVSGTTAGDMQLNLPSPIGKVTAKIGDKIIAEITTSSSNKRVGWVVTATPSNALVTLTKFNPDATKTHVDTNTTTFPSRDDDEYSTGDYYVSETTGWLHGPYTEGETSDSDAWPLIQVERGSITHVVAHDFSAAQPSPASTMRFGDQILAEGDIIAYVSGVTSGKVVKQVHYLVESVDKTAMTVTLSDPFNPNGAVTHDSNDNDTPSLNDAIYSAGDFIINANATMYGPYVEEQTNDTLAWPVKSALRDNVGIIVDTGSVDGGKNWKVVVENGIIRVSDDF
ncbi:hypothetical protein [Vibrio phage VCPH]|nr:hypothetical protein [Vibrio phage VCPH]